MGDFDQMSEGGVVECGVGRLWAETKQFAIFLKLGDWLLLGEEIGKDVVGGNILDVSEVACGCELLFYPVVFDIHMLGGVVVGLVLE